MPITLQQATTVVQKAREFIGKPYADVDCSHFVWEAYSAAGFKYTYAATATFATACAGAAGPFTSVDDDLQVADVLLFAGHMGLWDPDGCTVLGTNAECKRLKKGAPLLSSRSGGNRGPDFGLPSWWGSYQAFRWVGLSLNFTSIKDLKKGQIVQATRDITPAMVAHWKYSKECEYIGGGLVKGTRLQVADTSTTLGSAWVRLAIPGSSPTRYLKIAGEEYAHNFAAQ